MNTKPATASGDVNDEISALVSRLIETEHQLLELTRGEVDAILDPGGRSYLMRQAQEKLLQSEATQRELAATQVSILNALPANIALIDTEGVIIAVNEGWRHFAGANAFQDTASGVGQNYLKICEQVQDGHAQEANAVAAGIRSVLNGTAKKFELEYPCHSPTEQRWFRLTVTPLEKTRATGAVVMHLNITQRKWMEVELQRKTTFLEAQVNSSIDGILVVDQDGKKILQNQRFNILLKIPRHIAEDANNEKQLLWVTGMVKSPGEFSEKVAQLYANPNATSRDEIELKDGMILDRYSAPVVDAGGKYHGRIWTFRDITERKRMELELRKSESRHRSLFENMLEGYCYCRLLYEEGRARDYIYLKVNHAFEPQTGLKDVVGKKVSEVVPGMHEANPEQLEIYSRVALTGKPERFETYAKLLGIWFSVSVHSYEKEHFIALFDNITQRKAAEEALRESENKFSKIFHSSPVAIGLSTLDEGRYLDANDAFLRMLQRPRDEVIGRTAQELGGIWTNPGQRAEIISNIEQNGAVRGVELEIRGRLGHITHILWSADAISVGGERCVLGISLDITERKQALDDLQASEQRFSGAFKHAPIGMALVSTEGRWLKVNQAVCDLVGYSEAELLHLTFQEITHPEDLPADLENVRQMLAGTIQTYQMEKRYRHKRGHIVHVLLNVSLVHHSDGRPRYFISQIQDITERKRAERRFRRLVDSNVQSVFFWNIKGAVMDCNDTFLKLVRYTREDLQAGNISWAAMTPPEYVARDQSALEEIAANGICAPYEKEYIRKDGSRVPVLIGAAIFEDNPGEGVCFVLDLTERRKLEEHFRQAQKMEAIGQLAGGVAHDFNNILAVIQMQVGLLKAEGELTPGQLEFAGEIEKSSARAANLTRQLLLFSRQQTMQARDLDLNDVVANITKMLHRILGEDIRMQFRYAPQPLFVHADAGMLDQILINLTVNSRDAMPKGGLLIVETSAVDFDEPVAAQSPPARSGSFACMSVSDTGIGIPAEDLPRIFEPFFTTKDVGKGTGLGLATVFGIVQQHQGWVNVYSEVGKGTTFKIYLPRLARIAGQKSGPAPTMSLPGGGETILLVEDDPSLCAAVRKILSQLGYRILEARTGVSALEVWRQNRDEIRLLLTDMVMPDGMNGKELARQLLKENPQLKVIYASGYSADIAAGDLPLQEGVNFLTKPYETHALAQTVRNCLDGKGSTT
jgi:PAS domain S-box-containing protein